MDQWVDIFLSPVTPAIAGILIGLGMLVFRKETARIGVRWSEFWFRNETFSEEEFALTYAITGVVSIIIGCLVLLALATGVLKMQ